MGGSISPSVISEKKNNEKNAKNVMSKKRRVQNKVERGLLEWKEKSETAKEGTQEPLLQTAMKWKENTRG